jgi:hypothetical protein
VISGPPPLSCALAAALHVPFVRSGAVSLFGGAIRHPLQEKGVTADGSREAALALTVAEVIAVLP